MSDSDNEVTTNTQGLIPVYAGAGREYLIGYAEFEQKNNLLKIEVDTELAGPFVQEALRHQMAWLSIAYLPGNPMPLTKKEDTK